MESNSSNDELNVHRFTHLGFDNQNQLQSIARKASNRFLTVSLSSHIFLRILISSAFMLLLFPPISKPLTVFLIFCNQFSISLLLLQLTSSFNKYVVSLLTTLNLKKNPKQKLTILNPKYVLGARVATILRQLGTKTALKHFL